MNFVNIVCEPYVRVDYNASISNLRPLDIVWSSEGMAGIPLYHHVGIYLGNYKICHMSKEQNGVRINSEFGGGMIHPMFSKFRSFHPIIPFKNYKDIIRQAVWAEYRFWENNYNLYN